MDHSELHINIIAERLRAMEDALQRTAGDGVAPNGASSDVCKSCYAPQDLKGCPCGRSEWVPLPAAIIEARLLLDTERERGRTRERETQEVAA